MSDINLMELTKKAEHDLADIFAAFGIRHYVGKKTVAHVVERCVEQRFVVGGKSYVFRLKAPCQG